jgi:hypothetical protein
MRALIIGPKEKEKLQKLKEFAEANPIGYTEMIKIKNGKRRPVGDDPRFVAYIPDGFRVVYSVEAQKPGLMRHCSISVKNKGKLPNVHAADELIKLLGFSGIHEGAANNAYIWLENDDSAINILELM